MFRVICLVVSMTISTSQGGPFPLPAVPPIPPVVSSIVPTVYPYSPTPTPIVPGLPGYNNPYYNQYRTPGVAVPILTYSSEHNGDGSYAFSFSTADGKQAQETGYLKDAYIDNAGEPQGTQVVQGSYSYVSPEGTPIQVTYVADENGFRPSGVHIPANGKAIIPLLGDKDKPIMVDPRLNRFDPYYKNRYNYPNNVNYPGRYNSFRPQDPRYPYDPKYPYDPRSPYDSRYNPTYNYNSYAPPTQSPSDVTKKSA